MGSRGRDPSRGRDHPHPAAHQQDQRRHHPAHRHRTRRRGRRRRGRPPPSQRLQPGQPRHARPPHAADGVPAMSTRPATANDQPARPANPRTSAITKGRRADSARRRQRVIATLSKAVSDGTEISVTGIARTAGVDRTSFYRHRDLLARLHALEATPPATGNSNGPVFPGIPADRPACRRGTCRQAPQPSPPTRETPVRSPWRASLARTRARYPRRHRRPQPEDHLPGTAGHRPAPATRGTRRRSRRRPGHQPRAHGPAQHHGQRPVTRRARTLHHTCRRH